MPRSWRDSRALKQAALYTASFGAVFGVALANPSGFYDILEVFASFVLNLGGVPTLASSRP